MQDKFNAVNRFYRQKSARKHIDNNHHVAIAIAIHNRSARARGTLPRNNGEGYLSSVDYELLLNCVYVKVLTYHTIISRVLKSRRTPIDALVYWYKLPPELFTISPDDFQSSHILNTTTLLNLTLMFKNFIPWRFQSKTNFLNQNSNFVFRKILKTIPIRCNPASDIQYISLVCHRDTNISILSIKSLLRFYNDIQIIIQDDGSLKKQDIENFKRHIPGIKILQRKDADYQLKEFGLDEELLQMRHQDVSFLKLIDVNVLFKGRRIVADSDILFLKKPTEIIDWIQSDQEKPFYHKVLDPHQIFETHLNTINRQLGTNITELDYCSGLIGFNDSIPIDKISHVTTTLQRISKVWGLEQIIYTLLLKEQSIMLDPELYLAILKEADTKLLNNACMLHFAWKLKHKGYLSKGNEIINSLTV